MLHGKGHGISFRLSKVCTGDNMEEKSGHGVQESDETFSVCILDKEWYCVFANDVAESFAHIPRKKLLGGKLTELFPGVEKTEFFRIFKQVMETGKPAVVADEYIFEDGRRRWYKIHVYSSPEGILCISTDITERKQIEKEFRINEELFRDIIKRLFGGVFSMDMKGVFKYVSPQVKQIAGYEPDEVLGTSFKQYIQKRHIPKLVKSFLMLRGGHEIRNLRYNISKKDGSIGVVEINAFPDIKGGNVTGVYGTIIDITGQKKIEQQLMESRETSRMLLNATHDLVLLLEWDGTILDLNDAMAESLGVDKDEVLGKNLREYLPPEAFERRYSHAMKMKKKGKAERFTDEHKGRYFDNIFYPTFDKNGEVGKVAVFSRDITEEKKANDLLEESEEKFRTVVENAGEGIGIVDKKEKFIFANPSADRIFGLEVGKLAGRSLLNFLSPEQKREVLQQTEKRRKGEKGTYWLEIICPDGSKRVISATVSPRFDSDGRYIGAFGVFRDITERKKIENEIRRLSQFREGIINNANAWLDVLDEKENVVIWNRAAEKISGYSAEEVVGNYKIWEWLYPDENYRKKITEKAAAIIMKGETVEDFETTIRCKNGQIKIISWNSRNLMDEKGTPIGSLALGRDITERKKAEKELKMFKTIADNANYGVAMADIGGIYRYVNEYFAKVHGYKVDDVIDKGISIFYNEEQLEKAKKLRNRLIKEETIDITELWHTRRDGSIFPMIMSGVVIRDEDGKPSYVAVTALDISGYKQMEQELSHKDKMASLGRIASVVSHELNTPLANIGITAEYIASEIPGQYEKELEVITSEVNNAANIIKRILDFSRMDDLEFKELDIDKIIGRAAEAARAKHRMSDIEIKTSFSGCRVLGDEYRLFETLVNILDNAVLARDIRKKSHHIAVSSMVSGSSVVITVEDNGVGMDTRTAEESCRPFFTTRAKGEGAGLGLFIAKWIIEKQGGSLSIESEKNVGTKVTVTIPCKGV